MNRWLLVLVVFLSTIPSLSFSETWEEFQKLKSSDERLQLIPKGGPKLIPKDVIIEGLKKDCQITFTSDALLFHYGSAKIKEESMPNVKNTADAIKQAIGDPELSQIKTYFVDGHTCSIGSAENNCRLSWMRAQAMIQELSQLGVPREKLIPRGFGLTNPSNPNDTEANRIMNRRVVLVGDCAKESKTSAQTPCTYQAPAASGGTGRSARGTSGSSDSESVPSSDPIDTTSFDRDIAELADALQQEGGGGGGIGISVGPVGIMIPMGKSPQERPLPPGFKRSGPETTPQTSGKVPQVGKTVNPQDAKEQRAPDPKAKALPQGFKKAD
jgi:outer membrane protein OmpA-like peptidoglycan-associated protein